MFDPLRLAIVGCGGMGWRHALAIVEMNRNGCRACEIVAVGDTDETRANELADWIEREGGGRRPKAYGALAPLLNDSGVEAVDIVLPTWLHPQAAIEALGAGKHVLIEKPLALSVRECQRIVEAAQASGTVAAVAENYRRIPGNRAFRSLLEDGTLGQPQAMMLQFCAAAEEVYEVEGRRIVAPAWYQDPEKGGSYRALELGVHEIDLQQYWFGPITSVSAAVIGRGQEDVEHALLATLRFDSGMISQIAFLTVPRPLESCRRVFVADGGSATSSSWHSWQDGQIMVGANAIITLDKHVESYLDKLVSGERARKFPDGSYISPLKSMPTVPLSYGVGAALFDFASAARFGHQPEIGVQEASEAVAVCEAILQAARERHEIPLGSSSSNDGRKLEGELNETIALSR